MKIFVYIYIEIKFDFNFIYIEIKFDFNLERDKIANFYKN